MKKSILVTTALIATLSTGAFAYNQGNCDSPRMQQDQMQQKGMQKKGMKQNMHKGMKRGMHRPDDMRMFAQLNLTDEQKYKLSILKDEMRLEMKKARGYSKQNKIMQFISADGFDKEAFKQFATGKEAAKLELRANFMEKAFGILTKEQIAQLKTIAAR